MHHHGRADRPITVTARQPGCYTTLKHSVPKAKLIFLTMNGDAQLVAEAFRAGASAFLLKQSAAFELTDGVEKVLKAIPM